MAYSNKIVVTFHQHSDNSLLREKKHGHIYFNEDPSYYIRVKNKNSFPVLVKVSIDGETISDDYAHISAHSFLDIKNYPGSDCIFTLVDKESEKSYMEGKNAISSGLISTVEVELFEVSHEISKDLQKDISEMLERLNKPYKNRPMFPGYGPHDVPPLYPEVPGPFLKRNTWKVPPLYCCNSNDTQFSTEVGSEFVTVPGEVITITSKYAFQEKAGPSIVKFKFRLHYGGAFKSEIKDVEQSQSLTELSNRVKNIEDTLHELVKKIDDLIN